jgi:hypothetical protein
MVNLSPNEECWETWGISSDHSCRLQRLFIQFLVNGASSVHNTHYKKQSLYNLEATDRTVCEGYYSPLAAAHVQVLHEKGRTAPHAVYTELYFERGLFHMQSDVSMD